MIREGAHLTAGKFMQGEFPVMMFGLPAAALAIYHSAKPENTKGSVIPVKNDVKAAEPIKPATTFLFSGLAE
jgi:hypothetical protein